MSNYFDPGTGDFVVIDGNIVERDALRIAEAIKDYDENLTLLCLTPENAMVNEAPFVVCEEKPDGTLVRVLEAWQLDDRILERIYNADTRRTDVLSNLLKMENNIRKAEENRYQEKREENMELVLAVAANRKSSYSVERDNKKITFYEDRPTKVEVQD